MLKFADEKNEFLVKLFRTIINIMANNNNNYILILAGGKGRRLWPVSRDAMPKQFLDFFSVGKTQLQQTWERALNVVPRENIFISTNKQYGDITREQLPDALDENILVEPIFRNTAPSLAWATYRVQKMYQDGRVLVMPSDHAVMDEARFVDSMLQAFEYVDGNDILLTVGVKPTRPEPGYGYVQLGNPVPPQSETFYEVKSFTEKPDRNFAQMFMESGEFLWNTGMFCGNVNFFRKALSGIFPVTFRHMENNSDIYYNDIEKEMEFVNEQFAFLPNVSIESGILNKTSSNFVMKADFGWADLGTWHSIFESQGNNGENVFLSSRVLADNSHNNIVKIPENHVAVIGDLDGYIVAEKGNVLLICKKEDSSSLIRKYRSEVGLEFGREFV